MKLLRAPHQGRTACRPARPILTRNRSGWVQLFFHPRLPLCLLLIAALLGCRTIAPLPPVDLAQAGWTIRQGQAIWHPAGRQEETTGELLIALHPSGDALVEFSKTPFPILSVQQRADQWQIRFHMEQQTRTGSGTPPSRLLWLHVANALQERPLPPTIAVNRTRPDQWVLENTQTAEELVLVLDPR